MAAVSVRAVSGSVGPHLPSDGPHNSRDPLSKFFYECERIQGALDATNGDVEQVTTLLVEAWKIFSETSGPILIQNPQIPKQLKFFIFAVHLNAIDLLVSEDVLINARAPISNEDLHLFRKVLKLIACAELFYSDIKSDFLKESAPQENKFNYLWFQLLKIVCLIEINDPAPPGSVCGCCLGKIVLHDLQEPILQMHKEGQNNMTHLLQATFQTVAKRAEFKSHPGGCPNRPALFV